MPTEDTSCNSCSLPSSFARTQGAFSSMYWFALSASAVISRIARPNSRVSYSSAIRSAAAINSL